MKNESSMVVAPCGLLCSDCPIFKATRDDDAAARALMAAYYAEKLDVTIKPEAITCDGCLTDGGRVHAYCRECAIRKCCRQKGLAHCGRCREAPCDHLKKLHGQSHAAKHCFEALVEAGNCRHGI
jgi:hypothetical protein